MCEGDRGGIRGGDEGREGPGPRAYRQTHAHHEYHSPQGNLECDVNNDVDNDTVYFNNKKIFHFILAFKISNHHGILSCTWK